MACGKKCPSSFHSKIFEMITSFKLKLAKWYFKCFRKSELGDGHSLHSRNLQFLFSRSQTIVLTSTDARLRGIFIATSIKSTFWCMVHTQTEWVPAAPANTHRLGRSWQNFEKPTLTIEHEHSSFFPQSIHHSIYFFSIISTVMPRFSV
jgi:hypothetical protein